MRVYRNKESNMVGDILMAAGIILIVYNGVQLLSLMIRK